MKFPLAQFQQFCNMLTIDSKEMGQVRLGQNMMGTQKYHLQEVIKGLEEGIHRFVDLKGRQFGITTVQLALDLFWSYMYPGMQGTLATDSQENRDMFRSTLTMYQDSLPKSHRIACVANNNNFISWKNRSRLFLQVAGGARAKGGKGRGKGITFIHATECSSWSDEQSLASIIASLAEFNPTRLQVFESTARGFNLFEEMYREAKGSVTQKAIFIGWWRNEFYRKEKGSNEYRVYWDGVLTPQERDWCRAVKLMYDYEISSEQMAWFRWKLAEDIHDENYMMQEFPPHEELAFILSGKNFFALPLVEENRQRIENEPEPEYWRFSFGDDFLKTELERCGEKQAQLSVWEDPVDDGFYVIGCDPAYGSSSWKDRSVVEVYRCYADRFEQVAEFCMPELQTYKFAWVVCVLSGYYKNSMLNMEVNGPGQQVLAEIQNLRRQASMMSGSAYGKSLADAVGNMRYFLYKRIDSTGGGGVYHWITTQATKDRAMNGFRDIIERGHGVIHSPTLVDEMKIIVREEDGFLGASGRGKDDCTIASAIAAECYTQYFVSKMKQMEVTWAKECLKRNRVVVQGHPETPQQIAVNKSVGNFMGRLGIPFGDKAR